MPFAAAVKIGSVEEMILIGLTGIFLLGFIAQWLGWRFNIPSILLMLGFGLLVGPLTGILDPKEIFGDDLIFPLVSIGVAIILFEGGLTLNFKEFRESGGTIFRLISIGALACWVLAAWFAHVILDFSWPTSLLFGAFLVITGPTVVGPMLRQIRPRGKINYVLKWEGILNDPVGAVLAVLILEAIVIGGETAAPSMILYGIGKTLVLSIVLGVTGAFVLVGAMRRNWIPDYLHIPATLAVVLSFYAVSNKIQHESGLLVVTAMGILLANQRSFPVRHILEFKENLQVMLIAGLFIVLGARVEMETLQQAGWQSIVFLLLLIFVVRPISVLVSTVPSPLNWKERFFLMLMAPRGIVVTALASLFTFRLVEAGFPEGEQMFADTLVVIIGTVLFYGIAAAIGAQKLGLANASPNGVMIVGAHPWARMIGVALKQLDVYVAYIDSNPSNVRAAQAAGLDAHTGNIHSEDFLEEIDFSNVGAVLALTANDEINAFASRELAQFVGRARVYTLNENRIDTAKRSARPESDERGSRAVISAASDRIGAKLFGPGVTYGTIEKRFYSGATVKPITMREGFGYRDFAGTYGMHSIPLFLITENGKLQVVTDPSGLRPQPDETLVCLTWSPGAESASETKTAGVE